MPSHIDVAIAGAGIIGASIAWRLAQRGLSVALFDAGKFGGEASWAGAGMLAPGGEFDEDTPLTKLGIESLRMYPDFVAELEQASGNKIDFRICGALSLAYSEAEWESLQRKAVVQESLGIRSMEYSSAQVLAAAPVAKTQGLRGALFYPDDALVNPREIVQALRTACLSKGVTLFENCPVEAINVNHGGAEVSAPEQTVVSRAVVIAAGAWSGQIAGHGMPTLPASEPVKGQLIAYELEIGAIQPILRHQHNYLLQRASGLAVAGATVEQVGFDRTVRPEASKALHEQTGRFAPALREVTPASSWTGFRPASASKRLQLSHWHGPVWLAFGHYRNGILLAPVSAERIAEEITSSLGKA